MSNSLKYRGLLIIGRKPPPVGGMTIHIERLCKWLNKNGIRYTFLDSRKDSIIKIIYAMFNHRIVHIHTTNVYWNLFLIILSKIINRKSLLTLHGNYLFYCGLRKKILKWVLAKTNIPILLNQESYDLVCKLNNKAKLLSSFIPPYGLETLDDSIVNKILYHSYGKSLVFATNAFDLAFDKKGREIYGIMNILKLFRNKQNYLLVVSDPSGNYQRFVRSKFPELLSENILFISQKHSFYKLLSMVDVFIRNTITDGDSLSIHEALYLKKNVLATDCVSRPIGVITYRDLNEEFDQIISNMPHSYNKYSMPNVIDEVISLYQKILYSADTSSYTRDTNNTSSPIFFPIETKHEHPLQNNQVVVLHNVNMVSYPKLPPFHPDTYFPEYDFATISSEINLVYSNIRECFRLAGLDSAHYNTPSWNPLSELIKPGNTVLIKPNLVKESHPTNPCGYEYILTHGSVIRTVADYIYKALQGKGKIIIGDAPQTDSSFKKIVQQLGLDKIKEFYASHNLNIQITDFRKEEWLNRNGVIISRIKLSGDPNGYIKYDLGSKSEFINHLGGGNYYGADYDYFEVNKHHKEGRHEYLIAGSAINADVIFSLPKLKTHKKAGITISLKNLIGINGDKNWLPHHTEGNLLRGFDERPNYTQSIIEKFFSRMLRKHIVNKTGLGINFLHQFFRMLGTIIFGKNQEKIRNGNWWGNDTIWRTCLDINKIALYGSIDGQLDFQKLQRRHIILVDGVIGGQGNGPLNPDPMHAGIFVFGVNPPCVDAVSAYIMGFNPDKIPIIYNAFKCQTLPIANLSWRDIMVVSNRVIWNRKLSDIPTKSTLSFLPSLGWLGEIEHENNND